MHPSQSLRLIATSSLILVCTQLAWSLELPDQPRPRDRQITLLVTTILESQHLSRRPLDDTISQRTLEQFLDKLDPRKLYFTQEDLNQFQESELLLDDQLANQDLTSAYAIFRRFQSRVVERMTLIDSLLTGNLDFTQNDVIHQDLSLNRYAASADETRIRWTQQLKYDLLSQNASKPSDSGTRKQVRNRYTQRARKISETTPDALLEMYLSALARAFDPHTTYLSPPSYERLQTRMRLNYQGIGAELEQRGEFIIIGKLLPGGDAARQGALQVNDRILAVSQGPGNEMVDITGKTLREVVDLLRGPEGTTVRLDIMPAGNGKRTTHELTRSKISLTSAEATSVILKSAPDANQQPIRIGVIKLPSFYVDSQAARDQVPDYKSCSRDIRRILETFQEQNVDIVMLDLRKNGGGSLQEAIQVTGLFIDTGPVVQIKDSYQRVRLMLDTDPGVSWDGPLMVLTSHLSASASEIVAGAIQDYQRGIVVGDHATHGKGTVQQILDLNRQLFRQATANNNLGALKITTQKFYRPNGATTQLRGVTPDLVLPSIGGKDKLGESRLKYTIPFDQVGALPLKPYRFRTPDLAKRLNTLSQSRREQSKAMQQLQQDFQRARENLRAPSISLNQKQYLERFGDIDKDSSTGSTSTLKTGPYLEEILAIAHDYQRMLQQAGITLQGDSTP